jgi:O-antigen/teichoic acid export membrane protein
VFQLAKSEIRLQFSGYAIFAAKLVSVATGFIFQFMLARALLGNPETSIQYGIWYNINDTLTYFVILGAVVPFWAMRYYARGKEGAVKTGLATTVIISAVFTLLYLGAIAFILPVFNVSSSYLMIYLLGGAQIFELYFFGIYESLLQAYKPHAVGYGLVIQQVTKLSIAYVLIIVVGQPLLGAVVATIVSFAIQLIYYYELLAHEMKQRIHWGYVKEWVKGSLATIYNVVGTQLAAVIFLMLFTFGSENARGIYGAAAQITSIITFASFLSYALYPKLLADRKSEDITVSMKMVLMFALPMVAGAMALADSYIMLLSPENPASFVLYQQAYIVIIVLAFDALLTVSGGFLSSIVYGFESVDQNEKMTFRQMLRSRLFQAYTLPYVQAAMTIPLTYYVLTTYALGQPLQAAFSVCLINTAVHVVTLVALYGIVRKITKIRFPWKNIAKYLFASSVMGAFLFLLQPHPTRISTTLIETAIGGLIYAAVLMAIDKEAREFPKAVFREIKRMIMPKKPSPQDLT